MSDEFFPGKYGGKLRKQVKGQPSTNPKGRGKGNLSAKTIIRRWLDAQEAAKNPITGNTETMSQMDIISLAQLVKARKGDTTAFNALLDRTEGKAIQTTKEMGDKDITLRIIRGNKDSPE